MKKIEVGHNIRVLNGNDNYTGVVIKINDYMDNEYLKYVDIRLYDAMNKQEVKIVSSTPNYVDGDFSLIFLGEVDEKHVKRLQGAHKENHGVPGKLKPNKFYPAGLEVYVKTKKDWFKLLKTTAKMAFFEGGRCALSNITNIRRAK
jgi:hypothetical protein